MQLPDRTRQSSSASPHRHKSSKNASKHRHPQYNKSNRSASEHGELMSAKLDKLDVILESRHGNTMTDEGWSLVARSESDSSVTTGSSDGADQQQLPELTKSNVQLFDMMMMQDACPVSERIYQRAGGDGGPVKHASLRMNKHTATRGSNDSGDLLLQEPWVPACAAGSYDSDTFAMGEWIAEAERRKLSEPVRVMRNNSIYSMSF